MKGWGGYWKTRDEVIEELKEIVISNVITIVKGYRCRLFGCDIERKIFNVSGTYKEECKADIVRYVTLKYNKEMKIINKYWPEDILCHTI